MAYSPDQRDITIHEPLFNTGDQNEMKRYDQSPEYKHSKILPMRPGMASGTEHRQNIGKPSFRYLTYKTSTDDTFRKALIKVNCAHCEPFGWFLTLIANKHWPNCIIIRCTMHVNVLFLI